MNVIFTYPRDKFEAGGIDTKAVNKLISKHAELRETLEKLVDYYEGQQEILSRTRADNAPNATPVCNHAKDISDTAAGYFMGTPITYGKAGDEIQPLLDMLDAASVDDADQDNALMLSICGRAYEYVYAAEDEATLRVMPVDPRYTFIVCDESIEHRELFGVYYYYLNDDEDENAVKDGESSGTMYAYVYTADHVYAYKLKGGEGELMEDYDHFLGAVPIVEYKNNKFCIGDFEQQIGLIDAYNALMADRVNDKEQFVDAILVLYGSILGDDEKESDEALRKLRQKKLLELDEQARAEYLSRTFDEGGVEILRQALKEDIYTFSHVPNLTDKNFAGNSSGVAMEYKLLGLEMLTKIKERYYRMGLRKRLAIFTNFMEIKGQHIDPIDAVPTFSRGLPKNLLELSQIIANLSGDVSKQTLISLLPFVEDPMQEIEAVKQENMEALAQQQALMGMVAEVSKTEPADYDYEDEEADEDEKPGKPPKPASEDE